MIQSLGDELVAHTLEGIKEDRMNGIDSKYVEVIHGVIQSFVQVQGYKKKGNLKLYQDLFETPMLNESGKHYRNEAAKLLQRCSVSEYMEEVIKILSDENRRAQRFLDSRYCILRQDVDLKNLFFR